ncbi:ABC transporter permease [Pseudodonghicola xiamenensis]|uniref:ABC transporter permease n=1 Tax=Pseudodonghicola xiamenensis TaxID=337702 RepID=A0A8J3HAA1_9RHOB|nr:ABC transporter permease [Pseudodonghicola xiamenensis]GHG96397.1 ABC transporter permease [Pseudodonghicola xiamenensis]
MTDLSSPAAPPAPWRALLARVGVLPLVLVALCLLVAVIEPRFTRTSNLINVLRNASFLSIISAGQMLVMITGGFDISVGAIVALTSVSGALSMGALAGLGLSPAAVVGLGCLIGLIPALLVGLVNGICVAGFRISPFMVTIGTMSIATGLATYATGGTPIYDLPGLFTDLLGRQRLFDLPLVVYAAALIIALLWWIQTQTRAGRWFYAVGGNEAAALQSGIPARRYVGAAYVLSALLAGVVGLALTARVGSGEATLGGTLMLESISVAVIGGVSLKGGVGRIGSVVIAALFLSVLSNGMNLIRLDSKFHVIVIGVVVILAVVIEQRRERSPS